MRRLFLPPVVFVMFLGLMLALDRAMPVADWVPHPVNWIGLLPAGAGFGIASWHARLFRRTGTNIDTFGEPGKLTTDGLFRRTRNPMYLGMVICLAGMAFVLGSLSPLAGPLGFFLLAHTWYIPLEERAMSRKFGTAYAEYRHAVPRWL